MIVESVERLEIPEKEAAAILERILASIVGAIQVGDKDPRLRHPWTRTC
jgi:hypothetical protein